MQSVCDRLHNRCRSEAEAPGWRETPYYYDTFTLPWHPPPEKNIEDVFNRNEYGAIVYIDAGRQLGFHVTARVNWLRSGTESGKKIVSCRPSGKLLPGLRRPLAVLSPAECVHGGRGR